jgi:hypothetical protein
MSKPSINQNNIEINHPKQSSWQELQLKKAYLTQKCLIRIKPRKEA